jgi:hypothetical protein
MSGQKTTAKVFPKFFVVVWGDWYTVIGVRKYRDILLKQKPVDSEYADYFEYRLECRSAVEIAEAITEFSAVKLKTGVVMEATSHDLGVGAYAATDDGFSSEGAYCIFTKKEVNQ